MSDILILPRSRARAGGGGGGGPGGSLWLPDDYAPSSTTVFEALDADRTLYANTAGSVAATANLDPMGRWPTIHGREISGYAYPSFRPYADNMSYAPVLLTGDATHARRVNFAAGETKIINQNADFNNEYRRGSFRNLVAYRIRFNSFTSTSANVIPFGVDNSPLQGPGLGWVYDGGAGSYVWAAAPASAYASTGVTISTGAWISVVQVSDEDNGSALYINSTASAAWSHPTMFPGSGFSRSLGLFNYNGGTGNTVDFDVRRVIYAVNYNPTAVPVADVMDWLGRA